MTITEHFVPAGVIFDMDGLMLDTERPTFPIWPLAGKKFGWTITSEMVQHMVGINEASIRAYYLEKLGPGFPYDAIRQEAKRLITEEFTKNGIKVKAGLFPLLEHLHRLGVPAGVATSTGKANTRRKLKIAGLEGRFSVFACGDEIERGKPEPDIFLLAAERLGVDPARCVGFEDSPAGLMGLHAAGIPSVFVKDLIDPPPEVLATVWKICGSLDEAIRFLC